MTCQKRFVKKPCMFENLLSTDSSGEIPSEIMSCDEILLERVKMMLVRILMMIF